MKIKNLAFYGVMAAILGSVGTARADDSTIIASKGYVDAYAQKDADRVRTTWANSTADHDSTDKYPSMATLNDALTTVEGNIQSVSTNVLDAPSTDNEKLTKVSAIKAAATTGVRGSSTAVDTLLPTEKAVATALALKEDVANKQAAQDLSAAGATLTRWNASTASDTSYPTVKAVAQQIADVAANQAQSNWNETDTTSPAFILNKPTIDQTYDGTSANAQSGTAVAGAISGKEDSSNKKNATDAAGWNTLTAASTKSTDYPTVQAVENALTTITGDYEQNNVVTSANPDKATKVTAVQKGTLYMNGTDIANRTANVDVNAVSTRVAAAYTTGGTPMKWGLEGIIGGTEAGHMDDYVPTVAAVEARIRDQKRHDDDFYVQRNGAITASGNDNHSIVTYDAKGLVTGGISLPGLNDINNTSPATCTAGSPCVLSFYVDNGTQYYKWTNMDTEGLSGNPHVSGS